MCVAVGCWRAIVVSGLQLGLRPSEDGGDILKYFLVLRGKHTSGEALLSGEPQNDLRFAALLS